MYSRRGGERFETLENDEFWKWSAKITIIVCKIKLKKFFFYYIIIRFVSVQTMYGDFLEISFASSTFSRINWKKCFAYVFDTSICICMHSHFFFFFAYQKINIRHAGTFIFSAAALGVIITITKKKNPSRILNFTSFCMLAHFNTFNKDEKIIIIIIIY